MKRRNVIAYFALVSLPVYADVENSIDQSILKEEFNISDYWHDGMSWEEFLEVRNGLRREGLIKYVDKIEQQKMAKDLGLEVPKTYIASRDKVPFVDIISAVPSYVAKSTHLSLCQNLIIVQNGINILSGWPVTPAQVQEGMFLSLKAKPREVESWSLHHVRPGFMVQEYIPNRTEVKIQTIWGKAVVGQWRGEDKNMPTSFIMIWGLYDREGNSIESSDMNGPDKAPEWWPKAIAAAELMAKGTDALRVDFLIRENGELLLNELEIWPETEWGDVVIDLASQLNDGYRNYIRVHQA